LDFGRITFGATCLGVSKFAFEQAVKHSQERVQFKEPIGHFELIKKKLARMAAYTYAMEATNFVTAGIFDRGEEDYMCETAIIKVFASESAWSIINDTIQVFGGQAFFCDEPYERMMRDARLNTIGEGANEVLLNFIALVGIRDVGKQMEGLLDCLKSPLKWPKFIGGVFNTLKPIISPETLPIQSSELQYEKRRYTKCLRKFGWKLKIMLAKYQEGIFEEQLILERIANTVIGLYTTASVLSLLDSDLSDSNTDLEKLKKDLGAGKLYCQIAFDKIDENMTTLTCNYDKTIINVADSYTGLS